jgi:hypothetical protein
MQRLEGKRKWLLCAAALATVMMAGVSRLQAYRTQQTNNGIPAPPLMPGSAPVSAGSAHDLDPGLARQQELRTRMAEDDRHKRMVKDADMLLELATELKTDVDKSTKNETSVSALKKAEEIERLAHDVKERLKN